MIRAVTKYGMPVFCYSFFFLRCKRIPKWCIKYVGRVEYIWVATKQLFLQYSSFQYIQERRYMVRKDISSSYTSDAQTSFLGKFTGQMLLALLILGLGSFVFLSVGARSISLEMIWASIWNGTGNIDGIVINTIRIPRLLVAFICGIHFAVAGALMQGITNNPMASPSILGVNAGASFGLAIAMIAFPMASLNMTILFSFLGAGLATACILYLANRGMAKGSKVYLALAGSAISAIFMAVTQALVVFFDVAQDMSYWTAGGIGGVRMEQVLLVAPWTLIGVLVALAISKQITLLSLGDEVVVGLGGKLTQIRLLAGLTVLLLSGSAVAIAGPIGFVGLIVPHMARYMVGLSYEKVIPFSAVLGAIVVIVADTVARVVSPPFEVPLGAVTAIVGVPFFLYLANRKGAN